MFADPQSVTINGVATSLARTKIGPDSAVYTSADGNTTMTTKQTSTAGRFRREVRLSQQKISADPISALNTSKGFSVYLVVDEPKAGFSDLEIAYLVNALVGSWATPANLTRVYVGEY